jgi:AraC-like DNA-binding protein
MSACEPINNIAVIDCCEHTLEALQRVPGSRVTSMSSGNASQAIKENGSWQLIVVGATLLPQSKSFVRQLQQMHPSVPSLVLRQVHEGEEEQQSIRGDFVLSDRGSSHDFAIVRTIRELLPLPVCKHTRQADHTDLLQNVMRLMAEMYPDPELDLDGVANSLAISARSLSYILNREVGVSFPQLLRSVRIREAKRLLSSSKYSVKQVAMHVGFTNSHYFSRSFRELTGVRASEFRSFRSQRESISPMLRAFGPRLRERNGRVIKGSGSASSDIPRQQE